MFYKIIQKLNNGDNMSFEENKKILLKHKKEIILKFIISVILNVLLLTIPIYYSKTIDSLSASNFHEAYVMLIVLGTLTFFYRVSEIFNQKSYYYLFMNLYKSYMNEGLIKTHNNSLYSLSRFSLSEYSNIMSEDFELISDYYSTLIIRIVEIFQFLFIIVYFFIINKSIGIITLIISIFVICLLIFSNKLISKTNLERKLRNDKRISLFQEIFLSLKTIKGFNIFSVIKKRTNNTVDDYIKWHTKLNVDRYNLRQLSLGIVDIFKVISLGIGIKLIINGQMTLGTITLIYNYYTKLSELFTSIIILSESATNKKVANSRIYKLFQYAKRREIDNSNYNDVSGNITFDNILYGNKMTPILRNVSFNIKKNSFNILTGSMKNCEGVFDLLLRYNREHSGLILIDDVDINNYSMDNISSIIGFVMEYPNFFNTSIKDNLLMFDSNFENIVNVCKYLDIYDYIMNLENGFETILVDNASNIDTDIKYMLAFATVFLKKSKIILLNNIFDKVSGSFKRKIEEILVGLKKEHTIIMISRDVKLLSKNYVDQVILFSMGDIIGSGVHEKLMEKNEKYRAFIEKM